jgi:hypothetical protein
MTSENSRKHSKSQKIDFLKSPQGLHKNSLQQYILKDSTEIKRGDQQQKTPENMAGGILI